MSGDTTGMQFESGAEATGNDRVVPESQGMHCKAHPGLPSQWTLNVCAPGMALAPSLLTTSRIMRVIQEARPRLLETFVLRCPGHDAALAEDLFQNAVIYIHHRLPETMRVAPGLWLRFTNEDAVLSYLYWRLVTSLTDHIRRARRHPAVSLSIGEDEAGLYGVSENALDLEDLPEWHASSGVAVDAERLAIGKQTAMMVVSAVSTLKPDHQALLVSFVERMLDGENDSEPATPRQRLLLHRTRNVLRERSGVPRLSQGRPVRRRRRPESGRSRLAD